MEENEGRGVGADPAGETIESGGIGSNGVRRNQARGKGGIEKDIDSC